MDGHYIEKKMHERYHPQIKICGLTDPEQARICAELGADAIGLVFFDKSPRNVTIEKAAAITAALPSHVSAVGVFVDPSEAFLVRAVDQAGLQRVQLQGAEPPDQVADWRRQLNTDIIKVLFTTKAPSLIEASKYDGVVGFLVECGKGPLPGGNATAWDWSIAEEFAQHYPLVLAGGLSPDNIAQAISAALPDAVDASSSLEASPGIKNLKKVENFIAQVRLTEPLYRDKQRKIRLIL
jgi:phosphoribosylanthranilate isomerase